MTSMSSPRIKKPGLVSKSYRMSRLSLGCKMAGGFTTNAWENMVKTILWGKTLGKKPFAKRTCRTSSLARGVYSVDQSLSSEI